MYIHVYIFIRTCGGLVHEPANALVLESRASGSPQHDVAQSVTGGDDGQRVQETNEGHGSFISCYEGLVFALGGGEVPDAHETILRARRHQRLRQRIEAQTQHLRVTLVRLEGLKHRATLQWVLVENADDTVGIAGNKAHIFVQVRQGDNSTRAALATGCLHLLAVEVVVHEYGPRGIAKHHLSLPAIQHSRSDLLMVHVVIDELLAANQRIPHYDVPLADGDERARLFHPEYLMDHGFVGSGSVHNSGLVERENLQGRRRRGEGGSV